MHIIYFIYYIPPILQKLKAAYASIRKTIFAVISANQGILVHILWVQILIKEWQYKCKRLIEFQIISLEACIGWFVLSGGFKK